MSIAAPRYSPGPLPFVGRTHRTLAIIRRELLRRAGWGTWIVIGLIFAVVTLTIVVDVSFVPPFSGVSLATFYGPFSSPVWPFLILIVAAVVGAGSLAEDIGNRSVTLYLARPIRWVDYLLAKEVAVGVWIGIAAIGPGILGVAVVAALGSAPAPMELQALGAFLASGLLTTFFFTQLAVALSSLTTRDLYAGVGIFGITLSLEIGASVVGGITGNIYVGYASPFTDLLSVAFGMFDVPGTSTTNPAASALLVGIVGVLLGALAAWRLTRIEVVGE